MSTVLVLRTCDKNGKSSNDFEWPTSGPVEAPDWNPRAECGGGLHGLLWGEGDADHLSAVFDARWLVVEVVKETIVDLKGKVKFPRGTVVYAGARQGALQIILQNRQRLAEIRAVAERGDGGAVATAGDYAHASTAGYSAHASTAGDYAHASTAGYSAHASTAGDYAHASTAGDYAHASTAGYSAHASTAGKYAHASTAGYSAHASTAGKSAHASTAGDYAHASTAGKSAHASTAGKQSIAAALGLNSRVKAGETGCIVAAYWDDAAKRVRVLTGYVGEKKIKANTWYRVEISEAGKALWKEVA